MYKNLSPAALGVSGRQSELIELALTYGFRGLDIDMADLVKKARSTSVEQAQRFLTSAKLEVGGFELPLDWQGDETTYKKGLAQLPQIAEIAAAVGANRCYTTIRPGSDELPYHENFEQARQRLTEIGETMQPHQVHLGVGFRALAKFRKDHNYQFIHQAEPMLTLLKTIAAKNVGLALDAWNWFAGGGATDQLEELDGSSIIVVRLADAPADVDWQDMKEQHRLLPGTGGLIDSVAILRSLAEKNYEGPVTLSPYASCFSGMTRDAIVQRASQVLDELWAAAGIDSAGQLTEAASES